MDIADLTSYAMRHDRMNKQDNLKSGDHAHINWN